MSFYKTMRVLHIANWYPNPWNVIEGNFIRDQIKLFREVVVAEVVVVQVRHDPKAWMRFRTIDLGDGVRGYFVFTRLQEGGKASILLTTLLLLFVLICKRAWRFTILHFHIAIPLLIHVGLWNRLLRKKILISEHYSAYHYNFNLPSRSKGIATLGRPFAQRFPVLAVSNALLSDIRNFSGYDDFPGCVIANVVPLHGPSGISNSVPILFAVNRWVEIKDPFPMLEGLARAASAGVEFELVLGGFGPLEMKMKDFVSRSVLSTRSQFLGYMAKAEIAKKLAHVDGYLFSSRYETFSIACAEALGAGVPLIGPRIPAIAEYASPDDWEVVENRDALSWEKALRCFSKRHSEGAFIPTEIAARAAENFSPDVMKTRYCNILAAIVSGDTT